MRSPCPRATALPRAPDRTGVAANLLPRLPVGSEAPLPTPQAAAASLALERPPACRPVIPPARAVRIEWSQSGLAWWPVFRGVDDQLPSIDLAVVKEPDRGGGLGLGGELDEGEPPGPPRVTVGWQVDLDDAARLRQECSQRVRGSP